MTPTVRILVSTLAVALLVAGTAAHAGWRDRLGDFLGGKESTEQDAGQPASRLGTLSESDFVAAVLEALSIGARRAVETLGVQGGYLDDLSVRIPLPESLKNVEDGLRAIGQERYADEFVATMNRAAERAAPETVDILVDTIGSLSLTDARAVVEGADDAATRYLEQHAGPRLAEAILPIVRDATSAAGVTAAYKAMVDRLGFLGTYMDVQSLDLDAYVTEKALDGLYLKLAEEEKLIRDDPAARTTDLLKKVFGALGA